MQILRYYVGNLCDSIMLALPKEATATYFKFLPIHLLICSKGYFSYFGASLMCDLPKKYDLPLSNFYSL